MFLTDYLMGVTAGGPERHGGNMYPSSTVDVG